MMSSRRINFLSLPSLLSPLSVVLLVSVVACKDNSGKPQGTGMVADSGGPSVVADAAPATVDLSQCAGCQLAPIPSWTFEGIYRDAQCTDPLAQMITPACTAVPALGTANITYVDAIGGRKANESAAVTIAEQVAAETPRYRKAGTTCVRANEGAVAVTPMACSSSRACRDATGALTCTNCRTFANGCPDYEETRLYATITDPAIKGAAGTGGGGNLARLAQCCAALAAQGRALGASPEAGLILSAAAQCTALVRAAGPNGNAPELGALRAALAGRPVPAVCAGF
jgi:hypothetical protein